MFQWRISEEVNHMKKKGEEMGAPIGQIFELSASAGDFRIGVLVLLVFQR